MLYLLTMTFRVYPTVYITIIMVLNADWLANDNDSFVINHVCSCRLQGWLNGQFYQFLITAHDGLLT